MADLICGQKGRGGACELGPIVRADNCWRPKDGDNVVFEDVGDGGGGAIGDQPQHAEFAVASDGCEQVHLLRVGGPQGGDQVKAPLNAWARWQW